MSSANESRRDHLIKTAAKLFAKKGFERTTVRDIAKAVGMQSGSLFHHFKNKEEILYSVMKEVIFLHTSRMQEIEKTTKEPQEKILALIKVELEAVLGETHDAMSILVSEWRSLSVENQEKILKLRNIYEQIWLTALEEGKSAGLVISDPFIVRRFLTGALGWTFNWFQLEGTMSLDELANEALRLVIKK
jgi:AcrR family transcriptional regulator